MRNSHKIGKISRCISRIMNQCIIGLCPVPHIVPCQALPLLGRLSELDRAGIGGSTLDQAARYIPCSILGDPYRAVSIIDDIRGCVVVQNAAISRLPE